MAEHGLRATWWAAQSFEEIRTARQSNSIRLYLVFMEPTEGAGDRSAIRPQHFSFVERLEREAHLVAGGPIVDEETGRTTGRGLFVTRGASRQVIDAIMREEPFFTAGLRTYRIEPWRLAEGEVLAMLKAADPA